MCSKNRKKLNEKLAELEKRVTELENSFRGSTKAYKEDEIYPAPKTNKIGHDQNCECSRCLTEIN